MNTDNYMPIRKLTDKLLREYYSQIEKDLEEIINAPSLLARASKYYQLYSEPMDTNVCFLIFVYDNQVWFIREWNIDKFLEYIRFKQELELWCEQSLTVLKPSIVMPDIPK